MAPVSRYKTINDLPSELLFQIFGYLEADVVCKRYEHLQSKRFRYFDPLSRVNRCFRSVALVYLWRHVVCATVDDLKRIIELLTRDVRKVYGYLNDDELALKEISLKQTAAHIR